MVSRADIHDTPPRSERAFSGRTKDTVFDSESVPSLKSRIFNLAQLRTVLVSRLLFVIYVCLVVLNLASSQAFSPSGSHADSAIFEMSIGCVLFLTLELVLRNKNTYSAVSWHTYMLTILNVALYSRLVVTSGTLASEVFFMGSLVSMGIMYLSTVRLLISLASCLSLAAGLYLIAPRQDAFPLICQLLFLGTVMSLLIHFFRKNSMLMIDEFLENARLQTERLRSIITLSQRDEDRRRSISEALPLGTFEMSLTGNVMNANKYLQNLFPEFIWDDKEHPIHWTDMIRQDFRMEAEQTFVFSQNSNRCFLGEYCSTRSTEDGPVWLRFRLKLVHLPDETLYLGTIENVTCRKQIEQELMCYAEELKVAKEQEEAHASNLSLLVDELAESRHRAEESTRTKSEFLANMSHEIRTPMTAILGYTDVVLEEPHSPTSTEHLQTIKRNGEYLLNLINDLLDISKIEAGKMDIELIECSPSDLVKEILTLLRNKAEEKGLELKATFEGEIPSTIQTDPMRLRQILVNLIGNALKFTETGSVEIVTRMVWSTAVINPLNLQHSHASLEFSIKDTGIGMAAEQISKLFQPFTQADNSMTRRFGGTGLGLAISKRLSNMLGGDILVNSQVNVGSEFNVTVAIGDVCAPRYERVRSVSYSAKPELNRESPSTQAELPSTTKTSEFVPSQTTLDPPSSCRILLAEDGLDNQRLLTFLLKKINCSTTVVDNGLAAVEAVTAAEAEGNQFDLVLMDMQMPIMDGYSAATMLRSKGFDLPVIALTAHAMTGDRDKCIAAGCTEYLTKPVDKKRLYELISEHASKAITIP